MAKDRSPNSSSSNESQRGYSPVKKGYQPNKSNGQSKNAGYQPDKQTSPPPAPPKGGSGESK